MKKIYILGMLCALSSAQASFLSCDGCGQQEMRDLAQQSLKNNEKNNESILIMDRLHGRYGKYTLWQDGGDSLLLQASLEERERQVLQAASRVYRRLNALQQVNLDDLPLARDLREMQLGHGQVDSSPAARKALENAVTTWATDQLMLAVGSLGSLLQQFRSLTGQNLLQGFHKRLQVVLPEGAVTLHFCKLEFFPETGVARVVFELGEGHEGRLAQQQP